MALVILILMAIAGLVVYGVVKTAHVRIHGQGHGFTHGLLIVIWRWHTGQPWHGRPLTNAGWSRPADKALTATGHARRFWHRPQRRRALSRSVRSLAAILTLCGLWVDPLVTAAAVGTAALLGLVLASRPARQACLKPLSLALAPPRRALEPVTGHPLSQKVLEGRVHRRTWVDPLHGSLAPLVGHPLAISPSSWITMPRDRAAVSLALPPGEHYEAPDRKKIQGVVSEKLSGSYDYEWQLRGPQHHLVARRVVPLPSMVRLADVAEAIDRSDPAELVLGLGREEKTVSASLDLDSPHWAFSGGSGAGKSAAVRLIVAQHLRKGGIVVFLDCKWLSQNWAQGLPNAVYALTPGQCHNMLVGMGAELNRRNRVAYAGSDIEGNVTAAQVGARIMVVVEELNSLCGLLKSHWAEERDPRNDPRKSPALEALERLGYMGRQVLVNLLVASQRLSVNALGGSGGGDLRENLGVRMMWSPSAGTWKMLAEDFPQPPPNKTKGRFFLVTDTVTEVQVAYLGAREARAYAMSGTVALRPDWMFTAAPPPWAVADRRPAPEAAETAPGTPALPAPEQAMNHVSPVSGPQAVSDPLAELVTLKEAVDGGLTRLRLAGLRTARARGQLPQHAGYRGDAMVWRVADLIEFEENRTR